MLIDPMYCEKCDRETSEMQMASCGMCENCHEDYRQNQILREYLSIVHDTRLRDLVQETLFENEKLLKENKIWRSAITSILAMDCCNCEDSGLHQCDTAKMLYGYALDAYSEVNKCQ